MGQTGGLLGRLQVLPQGTVPPGFERLPESGPPADPGGQEPHLRVVRPDAQTAFEFGPGAREFAGLFGGPGGVKPTNVEKAGDRPIGGDQEKEGEGKDSHPAATTDWRRWMRARTGRDHLPSFVSSNRYSVWPGTSARSGVLSMSL